MEVYWANVEFDIKNPPAYENCVGGFVFMFLKAGDVLDAIPIIRKTLEGEDLRLTAIEFIAPYEQSPWTIEEDQALYDSLAKEAEASNEVVWDEIAAYESREE